MALQQPRGRVGAVSARVAETEEPGVGRAVGVQLEYRAFVEGPAVYARAIQGAVSALHQRCLRVRAVSAGENVEHGVTRAVGVQLEYHADTWKDALRAVAARIGCAIQR